MNKSVNQANRYTVASLILLAFMLCSRVVWSQKFPTMETYNVENSKLMIPEDLDDKPSIIFLAFTQKAEAELAQWYSPVYTLFLDESGFNSMAYDCNVKMVLMFTGASAAAADKVVAAVKKDIDPSFAKYLLFHEGNLTSELSDLGIKKKDDAYVFVIDTKGNILLQETGKYSETKLEKIAELMEL